MATLAPKLPWQHPFAGGYPGRGGQYLPVDADATDYLSRLAAADGASVEVGIAQAIEAFIVGCKADNAGYAGDPTRTNWDAIQACCIMAGARTISGALVPLKTPYGPELRDGTQTLESIADSATDGAWDASTQTMTNTTGSAFAYPRFRFALAQNLVTGKRYRITGRFSGDVGAVYSIRPRNANLSVTVNASTGVFDGTVLQDAAATSLEILLNASVQSNISVTIESLSVREDSFTPSPQGSWASGDYSRSGSTPGLKGNGSTKYLDSNRANNADGQDDQHIAVYETSLPTLTSCLIGSRIGSNETGSSQLIFLTGTPTYQSGRIHASAPISVANASAGFVGSSRSNSAEHTFRQGQVNYTQSQLSQTPNTENIHVFRRTGESGNVPTDARLAFYSVGAAIDLAALDERVTNLVTAVRFHTLTGLLPNDYDVDTIAYIVAAIEAGGTL